MTESLNVFEKSADKLEKNSRAHRRKIAKQKCINMIENNFRFKVIKIIRDILQGKNQQVSLEPEFTPSDKVSMNYSPIVSVDVKRSLVNANVFPHQIIALFSYKLLTICRCSLLYL